MAKTLITVEPKAMGEHNAYYGYELVYGFSVQQH